MGTLSSIAAIFLNLLKLEGVFWLDIRFRLSPYSAILVLCDRRCNYTSKSSSSKKLARKTRKTYSQNRLNNLSSNCILNSNVLIYSLISACFILGDPGADSGGEGKSKQAGKYGTREKKRTVRRAPGDNVLPDQFQTVDAVLSSDWCQKNTTATRTPKKSN